MIVLTKAAAFIQHGTQLTLHFLPSQSINGSHAFAKKRVSKKFRPCAAAGSALPAARLRAHRRRPRCAQHQCLLAILCVADATLLAPLRVGVCTMLRPPKRRSRGVRTLWVRAPAAGCASSEAVRPIRFWHTPLPRPTRRRRVRCRPLTPHLWRSVAQLSANL